MVPSHLGLPLSTVYYRARKLGYSRDSGVWVFTAAQARRIVDFVGKKRGPKPKKGGKR